MLHHVHSVHAERIIVGSGIAGLTTALTCGRAAIITRCALGSGSSRWAQGGIAAALAATDSPQSHAADTISVAGGISDHAAAEIVAHAAAGRIDWLMQLGASFDRAADGSLTLGREAGHSARRIVHADGDATGPAVMRALAAAIESRSDLSIIDHTTAIDLITDGSRIAGVLCIDAAGECVAVLGEHVVLACGGIGGMYAHTTNPPDVAGDGLAIAARAGVRLADIEFVQFHPTTLDVGVDPAPLLTEALRGEGALLVDEHGSRIMRSVHPDMELAPRDVVARAIWWAQRDGQRVFLDATCIGDAFPERFPTVWASASAAGFDARREALPVTPAAHYHMGGVATDLNGRTSREGLWAVGEVACTGLHGANRLASNSLLEGLVIGSRVGREIARRAAALRTRGELQVPFDALRVTTSVDPVLLRSLRRLMWDCVGIERNADGLSYAISVLGTMRSSCAAVRNVACAGRLIAQAALTRCESRGSHARSDYPEPDSRYAHRMFVDPGGCETVTLHAVPQPSVA